MREILFRGKTDDGEWKYGALLNTTYFDFSTYIIGQEMSDGKYSSKNDHYEVDPKSVGQFTGLTDKNGTKIFEGDLLDCTDRIVEVYWHEKCGTWDSKFIKYTEKELMSNGIDTVNWKYRATIIGNIHEVNHEEN